MLSLYKAKKYIYIFLLFETYIYNVRKKFNLSKKFEVFILKIENVLSADCLKYVSKTNWKKGKLINTYVQISNKRHELTVFIPF